MFVVAILPESTRTICYLRTYTSQSNRQHQYYLFAPPWAIGYLCKVLHIQDVWDVKT